MCNRIRRQCLLPQLVGYQGKGNSRQKEKQRRRQSPAQLRPHEERGLAGFGTQPGIVAVRLKHQHASQAAHPVNVSETMGRGRGHALPLPGRTRRCRSLMSSICLRGLRKGGSWAERRPDLVFLALQPIVLFRLRFPCSRRKDSAQRCVQVRMPFIAPTCPTS